MVSFKGFYDVRPQITMCSNDKNFQTNILGLKSKFMKSSTTCHSGLNQGLDPRPPLAAPTENRAPGNSDCIWKIRQRLTP